MPLSVLKDKGWFVSENALDIELDLCDQADRLDNPQRLEEFLLNTDLKEIGNPILYEKFDRKKGELVGPIILQLTKWRNISYPSVSNHDKNDGICVLTLSDGHGSAKAFSIDALKIDGNTTYGSKILLSGKIRAESGFLMLNNRNTTLLGGNVESLVEKWKTEKFSGNERKSINAPRWVPFSKARNLNIKFDKNFSSLRQNADSAEKEVDEKTAQFNAARQAQIEALDVPIPKPIKELDEKMKTSSLNEPQSSRQHFSQQRNDNFNQQRNDNFNQQRNDNFNQQRNDHFSQRGQDRGNFRNERGRRGGSARGNSDSRPQRNERQFDSQRRPQTDYQSSNRPDNRSNTQNQGYFQSDTGESFPREFHRGNSNRGNSSRGGMSSRGNNRGRGGGRQTRGSQSGRQQNAYNGNQQQQYQRSGGMQLNIDLDFPSL